jgi:hypothetical protein
MPGASPKIGVNRGNAGKGRPKGAPNKLTGQVKEMILTALDMAGGEKSLAEQAEKNPSAFMSLVGKVLPLQLTGDGGGPIETKDVSAIREAPLDVVRWLAQQRQDNAETHH